MSSPSNALAEKILQDLINVISNHVSITTLEIIPTLASESRNSSPVHVGGEHTLGLESWAAQLIYVHSHKKVIEATRIKNVHQYLPYLLAVVILNPDMPMGWVRRRELIARRKMSAKDEMRISQIALSLKPKSNEAFLHRRWLIKEQLVSVDDTTQTIESELSVVSIAADKHPSNYNAWEHGHWAIDYYCSTTVNNASTKIKFLQQALDTNLKFLSSHVSDYSCMHFRQLLLTRIFQCFQDYFHRTCTHRIRFSELTPQDLPFYEMIRSQIAEFSDRSPIIFDYIRNLDRTLTLFDILIGVLLSELKTNLSHNSLFPGHEALWYFRRFLVFSFYRVLTDDDVLGMCVAKSAEFRDKNGAIHAKDMKFSDTDFATVRKAFSEVFLSSEHSICRDFGPIRNYMVWLKRVCKVEIK